LPNFPEGITVKNLRNNTSISVVRAPNRGPVALRAPVNGMAEVAIQNLPPGYVLKSVAFGGKDKGLNPFSVGEPADIDLIIGYDLSATSKKVAVRGKVINAAPESKMKTIRFTSTIPNGPTLETPLQPDGSFEFSAIPPGRYFPGLQTMTGTGALQLVNREIVVGPDGVSGIELLSTRQFAQVSAILTFENGGMSQDAFSAKVVFVSANGRIQVPGEYRGGAGYVASVPAGERYTVSVTGLPNGFAVKSAPSMTQVPAPNSVQAVGAPVTEIVITLTRESR